MKKLFALFLSAAMVLSLTACGSGSEAAAGRDEAEPEAAAEPEATDAPEETAAPEPTAAPAAEPPAWLQPSFAATIEPTVLVDEQGVKITANELRYTNYSVELDFTLENNSDKDLSFRSGTLACSCNSVNGYMMDGLYLSVDIPAGKKANETASIRKDELLLCGITDIADIEMAFDIDDSDYDDYLLTEPAQIRTSLADSYDYAADTYQMAMSDGALVASLGGTVDHFAADELYNQRGVRIVSEMFFTNADGRPMVFVEMENTSEQMVTVRIKNLCINGLQVESGSWSSDDINAGKRRVITLEPRDILYPEYWDAYGIETVGSMAFDLALEDADGNALCDEATVDLVGAGAGATYRSDGELVYSGDGVRILSMGTVQDDSEWSDDMHLLLLAENNTDTTIRFDIGYDTLSVNGYMTDFMCIRTTLAPGRSGVLDVELQGRSLEKNGIETVDDIENIELTFELDDEHYHDIASFTATIGEGS